MQIHKLIHRDSSNGYSATNFKGVLLTNSATDLTGVEVFMDKADAFVSFYDNVGDSSDDTVQETVNDTPEASSEDSTSSEDSESINDTKEDAKADDDVPSESKGLLAKAQDEKRKRQDLEKQLDDMKAQIEKLSQSKKQEADAPQFEEPDTLDDGYTPYIKNLITNEVVKVKIELSRESAIDKWGDEFIEAEKFFMSNANENDLAKALQSSNPAKFVFDSVKKHKEQQKIQDPDYVTKLEAEIREKVLKELQGETPKTKLESKSILGKGSVAVKDGNKQPVNVFEMYNKSSAF
jgi:hypothetical protein